MRGFNLIQDRRAPFGSPQVFASLNRMCRTGANTLALVPFFWQLWADAPEIVRATI